LIPIFFQCPKLAVIKKKSNTHQTLVFPLAIVLSPKGDFKKKEGKMSVFLGL
jgi:hypothetical protein